MPGTWSFRKITARPLPEAKATLAEHRGDHHHFYVVSDDPNTMYAAALDGAQPIDPEDFGRGEPTVLVLAGANLSCPMSSSMNYVFSLKQ